MPISPVTVARVRQATDPVAGNQHRVDDLFSVISDVATRNLELPLIKEFGATGDGIADDGPALAALPAGAYLGTSGTYRVAANATLPTGVTLFMIGGVLAPDTGVTLTLASGATVAHLGGGVGGLGATAGAGKLLNLTAAMLTGDNLAGLASLAAARTNLGLGTLATRAQLLLGDAGTDSVPSVAIAHKEMTNLVPDPKLILGLTYWYTVSSQVTRIAVTDHPSAQWALRFQPGQGSTVSAQARSGNTIPVVAGDSYYVHFDAIAEVSGGTSQIQATVSCLLLNGTTSTLTVVGTPTTSWQTFSGTVTTPASAVAIGIGLQRPANSDGGTTYYRATNVAVRRVVRTSNILDANVTYAKLQNVSATSRLLGRSSSGAGVVEEVPFTSFMQAANNLSELASAATARTNLGLGTAATAALTALLQATNNLSDLGSAATARTNLGLTSTATTALASLLLAANNGSDFASANLTRNNIAKGTVALTDATTIATNCNLGNVFTVTLGGNRTLGAPTNVAAGASYTWFVKQDGTGSRTLAYNAVFDWGAAGAPTLTTTAAKTDVISAWSPDGTNLFAAITKGF